jgi:hypothetical protein
MVVLAIGVEKCLYKVPKNYGQDVIMQKYEKHLQGVFE